MPEGIFTKKLPEVELMITSAIREYGFDWIT